MAELSNKLNALAGEIEALLGDTVERVPSACRELGYRVKPSDLVQCCLALRDNCALDTLIDVCGVDYLSYGVDEWQTNSATASGFSRGVFREGGPTESPSEALGRFAVVYHLLSVEKNYRVRLTTFCEDDDYPIVDSVVDVWASANWYEREAFDLFGILFRGHPDLRRILTDYGFIGHPFRKDFPLVGNVEVRYDPIKGRVVYEPVSIEPRTLVPRVIRDDNRYDEGLVESGDA